MAYNCLNKEYKKVVNNDELLKVGEIRFKTPTNGSFIVKSNDADAKAVIIGSGTFSVGGGTEKGIYRYGGASVDGKLMTTVPSVVSIANKYAINQITMGSGTTGVSDVYTSELKYFSNFDRLTMEVSNTLHGNCADLSHFTFATFKIFNQPDFIINMADIPTVTGELNIKSMSSNFTGVLPNTLNCESLTLSSCSHITGNLNSFSLPNATIFSFYGSTGITGSLQTFAANQTRTTGTLQVTCNGVVTLDGTTVIPLGTIRKIVYDTANDHIYIKDSSDTTLCTYTISTHTWS